MTMRRHHIGVRIAEDARKLYSSSVFRAVEHLKTSYNFTNILLRISIQRLALRITGCDPKRYLNRRLRPTMTSTSPSPMTASPAAAVALAKPKVGGIYNNVPFTGGTREPLLARSFLSRPYMERYRITVMKVLKACDSGIRFLS